MTQILDKRIVATSDMMNGVSPGSAQVFDFMQAQGLSQSWVRNVFGEFIILNIKNRVFICLNHHISLLGPCGD